MKLKTKIRALLLLVAIAIISMVCVACGPVSKVPFVLADNTPTEARYKTEIYFRDYVPMEYGLDYQLYATYQYEDETGATISIVDELQDSLVFTFEYVTDYEFTLVRGGNKSDAITHTIKSMPDAPRFKLNASATFKVGRSESINRLAFYTFGPEELVNPDMASIDPNYKLEITNIDLISAEVFGQDQYDLTYSDAEKFTFAQVGFYEITFRASNRAGYDEKVVTIQTVNTKYHSSDRTGYFLEKQYVDDRTMGELNITQPEDLLVFDAPELMVKPADGTEIDIRFGNTATGKTFKARYSSYYDTYTVVGFDGQLDPDKVKVGERIFIKEPTIEVDGETVGGGAFSTMVVVPLVVTQANRGRLAGVGEGYTVLASDIDYSDYAISHAETPIFTGVFDGRGYTVDTVDGGWVNGVRQGNSLFGEIEGGVLKNLTITNGYGGGGLLFSRVEKATVVKNVVADLVGQNGYAGGRVALLGIVAETAEIVTVENCIINMFPNGSEYQGLLSTHAGARTIVKNFYGVGGSQTLHSVAGNSGAYPFQALNANKKAATEGVDYFIGKDAEILYQGYQNGNISEYLNDRVKQLKMYVEIDKNNIADLQTATGGYFILTEDIDMSEVSVINPETQVAETLVWKAGQTKETKFYGTLNGNGHKITNLDLSQTEGFMNYGDGAQIKNLYVHITKCGGDSARGGLFGRANGNGVTVENTVVDIDEMGTNGTAIADVVEGPVNVKNVLVNVKKTNGGAAFLGGGEVAVKRVFIDNVFMISQDGAITEPAVKKSVDTGVFTMATVPAEYFIDYTIQRAILDYDREAMPTELLKTGYDLILERFEGEYTEIDSTNFELLIGATNGYFILTEDIDASGDTNGNGVIDGEEKAVKWNASSDENTFSGVINGNGHVITGINKYVSYRAANKGYSIFYKVGRGAVIKNVQFDVENFPKQSSVIKEVSGDALIENCVFTFDAKGANNNAFVGTVNGKLTLKDTAIVLTSAASATDSLVANTVSEAGKIVLFNAYFIDETSDNETIIANASVPMVNRKDAVATIDKDYKFYTSVIDVLSADLSTEFLVEKIEAICVDLTTIAGDETFAKGYVTVTNENVDVLLTATNGYYVLGEDIDLTGKEWAPTETFTGTLNGRGYVITGLTTALFNELGEGAVIRTIGFNATVEAGKSAIANTISGAAKLENVGIFTSSTKDSVITSALNANLAVEEVFVVSYGVADENALLATGTGTIATDGLYVVASTENLYANIVGDLNKYNIVDNMLVAHTNGDITLNNIIYNVLNRLKVVIAVNQDNLDILMTETEGYLYLDSDIDLAGIEWTASESFVGTFDGMGYTIKNLNTALFAKFEGSFRNVSIVASDIAAGDAIIANELSDANVYNVSIKATGLNGAVLADKVSANANAYDIVVAADGDVKAVATVENDAIVSVENIIVITEGQADFANTFNREGDVEATEGTDYFLFAKIDELTNASAKGELVLTSSVIDGLRNIGVAYALSQANIEELLTATEGYWFLTEDVDVTGMIWKGGYLNGTFDGCGFSIIGMDRTKVANEYYYNALFSTCDAGVDTTVKNLYIEVPSATGNYQAVLLGRIDGGVFTAQDVVIKVGEFSPYGGAIVSCHTDKNSTINLIDVMVIIDSTAISTNQGFLYGMGSSVNSKTTIDNLVIVCNNEDFLAQRFDPMKDSVKVLGTDGEAAVRGEDYVVLSTVETLANAIIAEEFAPTEFMAKQLSKNRLVVALSQANIAELDHARSGYWYLTEDVDMTGITFDQDIASANNKTHIFTGIFNGNGYTISNFTPNEKVAYSGLFGKVENGAIIKNVTVNFAKLGDQAGLFGLAYSGGDIYLENVVITVSSADGTKTHRTPIVAVMQATVHLTNVMVVYLEENPNIYSGLVANSVSGTSSSYLVVDGLHVVAPGQDKFGVVNVEKDVFNASMNGGNPVGGAERIRKAADVNVQAVKGVDYFVAASLADLVRDNLATDLLKAQYDALTAAAGANA